MTLQQQGMAELALLDLWSGYADDEVCSHDLRAVGGLDCTKALKLAKAHASRWPEKLNSYHAGKIISQCRLRI